MKILFVISGLACGGAELQLLAMLRNRPADIDASIIYFQEHPRELSYDFRTLGIRTILIDRSRQNAVTFLYKLILEIRSAAPHIVHTFTAHSAGTWGRIAARLAGVRLIVHSDRALNPHLGRFHRLVRPWLDSATSLFLPNSARTAAWLEKIGISASKIRVVPNGVDLAKFDPDSASSRRDKWNVPQCSLVGGYVGRFRPEKRIDLLLDALLSLDPKDRPDYFILVGDGVMKPTIQARIQADPWLREHTRMPGFIHDVANSLSSLDYVVLCSETEGFPNVVLEAMAMRRPVVATDVSDLTQVLSGVGIVTTATVAGLREGLSKIHALDPGERARMGRGARERVAERWSLASSARVFWLHHQELLKAHVREGMCGKPIELSRMAAEVSETPVAAQRKIRVSFLIRRLGTGGAERQMLQLLRALDPGQFDLSLLTFYNGGGFAEELDRLPHVNVISLGKVARWDIVPFGMRLLRELRRQRPHVLHSYGTVPNLLAAAVQCFVPGSRLVFGIRCSHVDVSSYDWFCKLQSRIERLIAHRANLIIINSYAGLRHFRARGYPKDRMVVIPNGIDSEMFHPNEAARRRIRTDWGMGESEILVGIVGRIDPIKDHKTFLEAAGRLQAIEPRVQFVLVGDGPAPYVEHLRQLAERLKLTERILWTGNCSNVADIYNGLDIYCSSSVGEGFSNSIAEALSCGVPCVVTNVGDSAEIVGNAGIVVPPGNPTALAAALLEMIQRIASGRASLSLEARRRILPFGLHELSERTTAALRQIL